MRAEKLCLTSDTTATQIAELAAENAAFATGLYDTLRQEGEGNLFLPL